MIIVCKILQGEVFNMKKIDEKHIENIERQLLNQLPVGIILIDCDGIVQYTNAQANQLVAREFEFNKDLITDICPYLKLMDVLHYRHIMKESLNISADITAIITKIPVTNQSGHLIGAAAIIAPTEIFNQFVNEFTDLIEVKEILQIIMAQKDEAIRIVDAAGMCKFKNQAYIKMFGVNKQEQIGKLAEINSIEDQLHAEVLRTRRAILNQEIGAFRGDLSPIIANGKIKGSMSMIKDLSEVDRLQAALTDAKKMIRHLEETDIFADIICHSTEMKLAVEQAKLAAKTETSVLLTGEAGTGKKLFARAIHNESARKYNKFLHLHCGNSDFSNVTALLNSFEQADNGTVFLEEINLLSLETQTKLINALQIKDINVRIIASTKTDLEKGLRAQTFSKDLYDYLTTIAIVLIPLKDRLDDFAEIAYILIKKLNHQLGRNIIGISEVALDQLQAFTWPGNIRELENTLARLMIQMDYQENWITETYTIEEAPNTGIKQSLQVAVEQFEKERIYQVYAQNNFNKTKTAQELDISLRNLYYKMDKYKINKELKHLT